MRPDRDLAGTAAAEARGQRGRIGGSGHALVIGRSGATRRAMSKSHKCRAECSMVTA
jgi:hypothetical protein